MNGPPQFDNDWVKLPRSVIERLIGEPVALRVYVFCLSRARYPGSTYSKHHRHPTAPLAMLEIGKCVIGREEVADALNVDPQRVRTALRLLENVGFLTVESTKRGTIVTVRGYGETSVLMMTDQPAAQPTTNQPLTTNKKIYSGPHYDGDPSSGPPSPGRSPGAGVGGAQPPSDHGDDDRHHVPEAEARKGPISVLRAEREDPAMARFAGEMAAAVRALGDSQKS